MNALRKLWDEAGNVSEDEPGPVATIAAGLLFLLMLVVFPMLIWLVAVAMDIPA